MTNDLLYNIVLKMQGQNKVLASINQMQQNTTNMVNNIKREINTIKMSSVIDQVNSVADAINSVNAPGLQLSTSMADLSALTGIAGNKLKEIEGYARNSAKTFGGSAAQGVESYKLILGQLSPEIAKVPTALKTMGETVAYTSKLMGGDQLAATEVLTTAMNQYGVSLNNPIEASKTMAAMMNVMAAASQAGSAELPSLKAALEQSGMAAKAANVTFEETNAALEILDASGKKGSEGGVALRNILSTLAQGRFLPKQVSEEFKRLGIDISTLNSPSISLSQRLGALKPLLNDSALLTATFGKENSNAALTLISQTAEIEKMKTAITGTNSAYEQAAVVMASPEESMKRMKAQMDNMKISLFNATNGWSGYASVIADASRDVANMMPLFSGAATAISFLTNAQKMNAVWTKIVTGAQWLWNAALTANPIGIVVVSIAALVGGITLAWNKFEGFRKVIFQGWEAMKLFGSAIKDYVINRFQEMLSGVTGIGSALLRFFNGDWKGAWEAGKKATTDLLGINSGSKAISHVISGWNNSMSAGNLAFQANEKIRKITSASNKAGIAVPTGIPGAADPISGALGDISKNKKTKEKAMQTANAIATGGTKHNYITISIKELNGVKNYQGERSQTVQTIGQQVLDELLRVTAMASTATAS